MASAPIEEGLDALQRERATRDELRSVVDIAFEAARHETPGLGSDLPLRVHARYQREEILAALGLPAQSEQLP